MNTLNLCEWWRYCGRTATTLRFDGTRRVPCCRVCADLEQRVSDYVNAYRERYGRTPDTISDGAVIAL